MVLNYKQLAFILDVKPIQALEKIIYSYCKENDKVIPSRRKSVIDYKLDYPTELDLLVIQKHTGIPLAAAIMDIQENYLKRHSSKKFILCDYPEKEMLTNQKDEIKLPTALASLLHPDTIATIKAEWKKRYGIQHRSEK